MNQTQLDDICRSIDFAMPAKAVELKQALSLLLKKVYEKTAESETETIKSENK